MIEEDHDSVIIKPVVPSASSVTSRAESSRANIRIRVGLNPTTTTTTTISDLAVTSEEVAAASAAAVVLAASGDAGSIAR